jgi:type I restriction enzyme S subunit
VAVDHPFLPELPAHWELRRLKHVAVVVPSNVDKKSYDGQTAIRLCNYTDVYYNERITADLDFMPATATLEQIARFGLRADDVIITKDSETADDIAVASYVPEGLPGIVCGYHLAVVRPRSSFSGAFAKRFFDSRFAKAQFCVSANGLTRVGLGRYELHNSFVPVPPVSEQLEIADFLDRETSKIDALVAEQRRLMELLQEKRHAVISHTVTKGVNPDVPMKPSGIEWLGEVPAHWPVMPIRRCARLESGHTPSRQHPEYWIDCSIPWFTLADVWQIREGKADYIYETHEKVSDVGLANSAARLLPKGTVMLSRTASVGFSAMMGVDMATTQDFANWVCGERLLPEYLLLVFRAMQSEFRRLMMGSTHNTIYMPDIQALRFALPPLTEQRAIVSHVHALTRKLDRLLEEVRSAENLLLERRAAVISAAVTGQIDVRHLAPAEAA